MEGILRKAKLQDSKAISELVWHFAKDRLMLARPVEYINPRIRDYFVWVDSEKIVGCAALKVWNGKWAEIISWAVYEEYSGQGIGTELLKSCIAEAGMLGVKFIVIFTPENKLVQEVGFTRIFHTTGILPRIMSSEKSLDTDKSYILEVGGGKS